MKKLNVFVLFMFIALLSGCGTSVKPGHMGLRYHPLTSGLNKEASHEGFYWRWPWNDVLSYSTQWQTFTERVDILTKDDLHVRIDTSVVVRPVDKELYQLQIEIGPDFYSNIIKPEFLTVTRTTTANYNMTELPRKSQEIETKILETLRERIKGKHLELDHVTINHIEFPSTVLKAIEVKLAKEQEKFQKEFELDIANKDAEIARTRAKGEGDAIKIRAQGEAEAQKIIDSTLTQRFLQFKAFESPNAKFIYVPTGKDGLPIIVAPEVK